MYILYEVQRTFEVFPNSTHLMDGRIKNTSIIRHNEIEMSATVPMIVLLYWACVP